MKFIHKVHVFIKAWKSQFEIVPDLMAFDIPISKIEMSELCPRNEFTLNTDLEKWQTFDTIPLRFFLLKWRLSNDSITIGWCNLNI